jgi:SAM-dependent methyltransferase
MLEPLKSVIGGFEVSARHFVDVGVSGHLGAGAQHRGPNMPQAQYLGVRRLRPITCLGDVGELTVGRQSGFDASMPADHTERHLPRKWWEWDYIADCAESMGLLTPTTTALGLGVGNEPLIFHFANSCGKVVATDLYSTETAWKEARFAEARRVLDASPISFPRERVEVLNADMRSTGLDTGSVDLVWSCSSIEHVPTLVDLFAVFSEIHRVLKIDGHAILTTEYCITGNPYLLPGVNAWNREIFDLMVASLPGFELQGAVDLSFNALHPGNAARPRRYMPVSFLPASSKLMSYYHRAGTMANPVGLSIIVPIAFVLKKISLAGVVPWEKAAVPQQLRTFSEGVHAFFAGDSDKAVEKLEMIYEGAADDIQLRHLAFRFLIDARARRGEMEGREEFADRIQEFLKLAPAGPVQDADCLDICGYLLGECGRVDEALAVYERCLLSPSTSKDHVFELALRYVELVTKNQVRADAHTVVASVLADLMQFGMTGEEMNRAFFKPAASKLPTDLVAMIRKVMNDQLGASQERLYLA